jgi:ribosomal protein S18 acetylase RimI-like enzyme
MTVTFRPLTRADLAIVGPLVTASFEVRLTPFMIATQHGWPDFVGVALDHPEHFAAQRLRVAELDGQVVGFADFRAPGDGTGFLSYICVAPAARGRGIARGLFHACVREAGDLHTVALDVFEDNEPARAMYAAMGFDAGDVQVWWKAPIPTVAAAEPVTLSGLPLALAAFERYGFCELSGSRAGEAVRCGRIGPSVLRLFSSEDFDDAGLAASLARDFPELTATFGVLPASHRPTATGAEPFNRVIRMTTHDLPRLLGAP